MKQSCPDPIPDDDRERRAFAFGLAHVRRCAETGADAWASARILAGDYEGAERHAFVDGVLAALEDEVTDR